MSNTVYIYALCEPTVDRAVRYVGKTVDLTHRYNSHISDALSRFAAVAEYPRSRWIRKLLADGKAPLCEVLEISDSASWREAERAWIVWFRKNSVKPCLNITDGGEGVHRDHSGKRFGGVIVQHRAPDDVKFYVCRCDCGRLLRVSASNILYRQGPCDACVSRFSSGGVNQGQRFSRLVAIALEERRRGKAMGRCLCDCGSTLVVQASNLKCGGTKSCGCLRSERIGNLRRKHERG